MEVCDDSYYAELFRQYVEICNRALRDNKERFPFKQILGAARQASAERQIEVIIAEDAIHNKKTCATMVILIDDDEIKGKPHGACAECQCHGRWNVRKSYLQDVVNHPDAYIQNPAKINWEWMYTTAH